MPGPARQSRPAPSAYADRPWLGSYPEGVPADYDFPKVPLTRLLDDAASSFPTGTALAFLGTTMTYRELKDAVDRFAAGLAGLGVTKGDRVAIVLPNCPQNVIAFFAALRLGAVVVQHNPLYTESELRHQLADCGAKVAVCLDRVYDVVARVRPQTALEQVVVTSIADYLPRSARLKLRLPLKRARRARTEMLATLPKGAPVRQFTDLVRTAAPARQTLVDSSTDLALLQYTGGTTGASKGAMLTHDNLVSNAYMNRLWDTGATAGKEVTLCVLPLFHAYGLTVCMNATVLLGGTLVLLPRFDVDQVFAAIDQWKPTMFPGVPPIYKALSDSPKARSHDLRSIRLCVSGAMRLPGEIAEQFERISGARLVEGYGMTEASPSTHCNPVTGERRSGSIGLPLPGTQCKVVDRDDASREVPVGEPGELAVRGPQVFAGYWGRETSDDLFTDDGYLLTGDIAVMDEDGFFAIVDRKKELIIAGGFNVYPSEVEEVLLRLPGVDDAVVVGVPDKYRGETVKAFVVRSPGSDVAEAEVIEHCSESLAAYKVPKVVEFRDALPRTVVGKVLRRVLLEQEREKAAAEAEPQPASVPGGRSRPAAGPGAARGTAAPRAPRAKKAVAAAPVADQDATMALQLPEVGGADTDVPVPGGQPEVGGAAEDAAAADSVELKSAAVKRPAVKRPAVKRAAGEKAPAKTAPARRTSAGATTTRATMPAAEPPAGQPLSSQAPTPTPPAKKAAAKRSTVGTAPVSKAVVRPRKTPPTGGR